MRAQSAKTAIVTGASSGIGRASAEALAKAGFTGLSTSRRSGGAAPQGTTMLVCDVTDEASVKALVDAVLARTGRIDVVVNNAGLGLFGGAEESFVGQVKGLFDVNLFGVLDLTNAVLRHAAAGARADHQHQFRPRLRARPLRRLLCRSKHALEGYSKLLDHEVRAFNVRISLIEPGCRSPFDQNSLEPDLKLKEYAAARTRVLDFIKDVQPTADTPEMVAEAVSLAATDTTPKRRYTVGKVAGQISVLRRLVPAGLFDKVLRQQLRLPA